MNTTTDAYYDGRNSTGDNGEHYWECDFTQPEMIAAFNRGRRDVLAEFRLSADTEWDNEAA